MSAAVQQLLDSFDTLADADKHQAVTEILRRFGCADAGDLSEDALLAAADELFLALDDEEVRHASP
jgi:hypothetical protein